MIKKSKKEYGKEYYLKNKEKLKEKRKKYCLKNKEHIKEYDKEYRLKNKEKRKKYRLKNKEKLKEYDKEYRLKNKEKIKEYYLKNKEKLKEYDKEYRLKNKEKKKECGKEYYLKNKEKIKEKRKEYNSKPETQELIRNRMNNRYNTDINFRILAICRARLFQALKGNSKSASTMELIGCTVDELRRHIESNFEPWMNWENQGLGGWDIDHIKACSRFNFEDPKQQRACFHWSNLQPIEHIANIKKGTK